MTDRPDDKCTYCYHKMSWHAIGSPFPKCYFQDGNTGMCDCRWFESSQTVIYCGDCEKLSLKEIQQVMQQKWAEEWR